MENLLSKNQILLKGIPASPGIAIARAFVIQHEAKDISNKKIFESEIDNEIERLNHAINFYYEDCQKLLNKVKAESKQIYQILESNTLILSDPYLKELIVKRIKNCFLAESAVIQEFDNQKNILLRSENEYFKERAQDFDNIKVGLIQILQKKNIIAQIPESSIVVAKVLSVSDIIKFKENNVLGFITEIGGLDSHSSILIRSFGLPEVIGVSDCTKLIENDSELILDGNSGKIFINPNQIKIDKYKNKLNKSQERKEELKLLINDKSLTLDGKYISLKMNLDHLSDLEYGLNYNADGFGLVRSESMLNTLDHIPDEEEQFNWYNLIASKTYPNWATIRVFDFGSDKYTEGLPTKESNPALGVRGLRFLLGRVDILKIQLKAILRSSNLKNVKILLPMVTSYTELEKFYKILNSVKNEMLSSNLEFDHNIQVGIMIETPAAAIMSDILINYVDFFSIGTNDLTQYITASDRTNELVSNVYDSFHPSVLKTIYDVIKSAKNKNKNVSVCGELASHPLATSLLIGFGADELSVSSSSLLETKHRIRKTNCQESSVLAKKVISMKSSKEIKALLY